MGASSATVMLLEGSDRDSGCSWLGCRLRLLAVDPGLTVGADFLRQSVGMCVLFMCLIGFLTEATFTCYKKSIS